MNQNNYETKLYQKFGLIHRQAPFTTVHDQVAVKFVLFIAIQVFKHTKLPTNIVGSRSL
jgi:hypothetical protein